jgi:YegS/Rv2252/BmrU family lipid kinase
VGETRPVLIVNPRSAGGLSEKAWAALVGPITDGLGACDVRFTERGGDGRRLATEEAAAGRRLVVAVGGDGTISEVADGLVWAGYAGEMAVIPRGTGGDFRRTLELPTDVGQAARHAREAQAHPIDVGRATLVGNDGAPLVRHFVNVASFGFSADVATRANASSKRLGARASFLAATFRSLVSYDNVEVLMRADGEVEEQRRTVLLGAVGNGCFFGGGMKICPGSCLDDGVFDAVMVGDFGRMEIVTKIGRLYEGTHLSLKEVTAARVRRLQVRPVDPEAVVPVELDGETPGRLPATFEIVPRVLRLRF